MSSLLPKFLRPVAKPLAPTLFRITRPVTKIRKSGSEEPFRIPLFRYNAGNNVPSAESGSADEGEFLQVLPHAYRIPLSEETEEILGRENVGLAAHEARVLVRHLETEFGTVGTAEATGERATSSAARSEEEGNQEKTAAADETRPPPVLPVLPKFVRVRVAPREMEVETVPKMSGALLEKLQYHDRLMETRYFSPEYLEPTALQPGDWTCARLTHPPQHLLSQFLSFVEKKNAQWKFSSWISGSEDFRWRRHKLWTAAPVNSAFERLQLELAFSGGGGSAEASSSASAGSGEEPRPEHGRSTANFLSGGLWKRVLRAHPTAEEAMRSWRELRVFLDARCQEFHHGVVAGPAFGGKYLLQGAPGQMPERSESPPWSCISEEERRAHHAFFGRLGALLVGCVTTASFLQNRWKDARIRRRQGREEGKVTDPTEVQRKLRENEIFQLCEVYRGSAAAGNIDYNWRKSTMPFLGFQLLNAGVVYPLARRGTMFFKLHAFSSFFVASCWGLILWHDLMFV